MQRKRNKFLVANGKQHEKIVQRNRWVANPYSPLLFIVKHIYLDRRLSRKCNHCLHDFGRQIFSRVDIVSRRDHFHHDTATPMSFSSFHRRHKYTSSLLPRRGDKWLHSRDVIEGTHKLLRRGLENGGCAVDRGASTSRSIRWNYSPAPIYYLSIFQRKPRGMNFDGLAMIGVVYRCFDRAQHT